MQNTHQLHACNLQGCYILRPLPDDFAKLAAIWLKVQTKPEPLSGLQRNAIKSTMLPRTSTDVKTHVSVSPQNGMILTAYEKLASVTQRVPVTTGYLEGNAISKIAVLPSSFTRY